MPTAVKTSVPQGGIQSYYQAKIEAAELDINQKTQNLRRLEAQRNALNARGTYQLRSNFTSLTSFSSAASAGGAAAAP